MRLLLIEDNAALLNSLTRLLSDEFEVDAASDGEEGLFLALQHIYDVVILDVMMPGMDGFHVVQTLREKNVSTPVLFLTAKDGLEDRVKGLELGGDDYLVKPFQAIELKARIRAILRRSGSLTLNQTVRYRNVELLGKEHAILIEKEPVRLTLKQYELLEYLVQNAGKILTKEQIYDRVWGFGTDTTMAIVEVYIHHIRKKLLPFGYHNDIQTIRGIGYLLKQP